MHLVNFFLFATSRPPFVFIPSASLVAQLMQQAAPVDKVRPTTSTGMRRRETIQVKLIWGVESGGKKSSLWLTNSDKKQTKQKSFERIYIRLEFVPELAVG